MKLQSLLSILLGEKLFSEINKAIFLPNKAKNTNLSHINSRFKQKTTKTKSVHSFGNYDATDKDKHTQTGTSNL